MNERIQLKNRLKEIRGEKKISQGELAKIIGVSRNTISSIETEQYCPTANLAYAIAIALDEKFEDIFYFENFTVQNTAPSNKSEESFAEKSSLSDKAIQRIREYLTSAGFSAEQILDFILYITK